MNYFGIKPAVLWSLLGLWCLTALALYALSYDLMDRLDILALVFPLGMVLAYLYLLIVAVVRSIRPRPSLRSVPYLAAVIVAGVLAWCCGRPLVFLLLHLTEPPARKPPADAAAHSAVPGVFAGSDPPVHTAPGLLEQ